MATTGAYVVYTLVGIIAALVAYRVKNNVVRIVCVLLIIGVIAFWVSPEFRSAALRAF